MNAAIRKERFSADEARHWLEAADSTTRGLISQSWRAAVAARGDLAEDFYARVFTADPAAAGLFPGDMTEQKKLLTKSMSLAIELVDNPDELLLLLRASGARHAHYGIVPGQFNIIGQALLETVEERGGAAFTPAHRNAWIGFYSAISTLMRDGMRKASKP